jgi:hypothetical protein
MKYAQLLSLLVQIYLLTTKLQRFPATAKLDKRHAKYGSVELDGGINRRGGNDKMVEM